MCVCVCVCGGGGGLTMFTCWDAGYPCKMSQASPPFFDPPDFRNSQKPKIVAAPKQILTRLVERSPIQRLAGLGEQQAVSTPGDARKRPLQIVPAFCSHFFSFFFSLRALRSNHRGRSAPRKLKRPAESPALEAITP